MIFILRKHPNRRCGTALLATAGLFFLLLASGLTWAAETPGADSPAPATAPEAVNQLLENALNSERSNLADIEQSLKRWEVLQASVASEIESYRIQNAAHGNLLLVLQTRIEDLQTALNNNRLAIKGLEERIAQFEKYGDIADSRMAQLADRIAIAENQLADLDKEILTDTDRGQVRQKLDNLLAILREKQQHGETFLKEYETLFSKMKAMRAELTATRQRLEERLRAEVQADLFERSLQPISQLESMHGDLKSIQERLAGLLRTDFWRQQWVNFLRSGVVIQTVFILLFLVAVLIRRPIRRYLQSIEQRLTRPEERYRRLALVLLRRSFLLLCAAAILLLYDLLKLPHINFSLARFLNQTVATLLLVRWGIDFLQRGVDPQSSAWAPFMQKRLVPFLQWLRLLVVGYLALMWVAGSGSQLVWLVRLVFEVALLVWLVVSWRAIPPGLTQDLRGSEGPPTHRRRVLLAVSLSHIVAGVALLMDLTGYRALAGHWLVSWTLTMVLGLWAYLVWHVIREWYAAQKAVPAGDKEAGLPAVAAPVGWFMVQMARLVWLGALLTGALLIWSSRDVTTATLAEVFNLAFAVGSLSFSVKGLLLAVIILCATHVATRIGRRLLREKVLSGRDFERGLKDSIVTITSYVMWGLGLVLALGVLGVNATSLAVVFGALSIGIGFGLQNIFNNFISGLILLFERPIQVGDYVEVGGVWAEVKQINVRSTIVQTFDNAAVIIPNSEFISQQVTNWSFKDPRMRRHVDVGVAYGSDIECVRDTLLDIASKIPDILYYPKPDVIFLDHGDSALIFRLRFWTHVDNYYSTTTAVRFELDRRFRELGIEIAFPQRDLHIRTAPATLFTAVADVTPAASPPPDERPAES